MIGGEEESISRNEKLKSIHFFSFYLVLGLIGLFTVSVSFYSLDRFASNSSLVYGYINYLAGIISCMILIYAAYSLFRNKEDPILLGVIGSFILSFTLTVQAYDTLIQFENGFFIYIHRIIFVVFLTIVLFFSIYDLLINKGKKTPIPLDKTTIITYSFYLGLGSFCFYFFITNVKNILINKPFYDLKIIYVFILFFAGVFLIYSAYSLLRKKSLAKIFGIVGCLVFLIYLILFVYNGILFERSHLGTVLNQIVILFFTLVAVIYTVVKWNK